MENVTLTKEQLQELTSFIRKKGFKQPLVIVEILDHFACKVEEKLTNNNKLSLDEAIASAHRDFGVAGFAPLVKAYEAELKKKYRIIYRAEMKKVLMNPFSVVVTTLVSFLFYKGFIWAETHSYQHLIGINDVGLLAFIAIVFIAPAIVFYKYRQERKNLTGNPIITALNSRSLWSFVVFNTAICQPSYDMLNAKQLMFFSIVGTIGMCLSIIAIFTMRRAMKIGYSESIELNNYLKEIEG